MALGYLFIPNDVVPESVYGAYGYMDDMYIVGIILHNLLPKYSDMIHRLWADKDDFDIVLKQCILKGEKFLDEMHLKQDVLRYCGLID